MQSIICSGASSPRQIRWIDVNSGNLLTQLLRVNINDATGNLSQTANILVFHILVFQHEVDFLGSVRSLKLLAVQHFLLQFSYALNKIEEKRKINC